MESLGINLQQIIFQIVNFSILLFVLKKFLYKPVLEYIEKQKKQEEIYQRLTQDISNQKVTFEQATSAQKQELQKLYNDTVEKAKKDAREIIDTAKETARNEGKRLLAEYELEARQNTATYMESAKQEVYQNAVKISEAILTSSLTEEQKSKLMKMAVENLNNEK